MRVALAPARLVALGGQAALELADHAVHRREVLQRPGRKLAVELVQRPRGRQRLRALDLRALELAPQVGLERADLLARELDRRALALHQSARVRAQPERAADPLHVDAEHAGALAAAAERGDRQPCEVAQRALVAAPDRLQDLLAQRLVVDPLPAGDAVDLLAGGSALAHAVLERGALGGAEEVALEHDVEHAPVVRRLGERGGERLAERRRPAPVDLAERGERVVELRRADRHALGAQRLREPDQLPVKRQGRPPPLAAKDAIAVA